MPGSNQYSMDPSLGEVSTPSLVSKPTSPFYQKKAFQRNTFDKDTKMAEMYGTQASRRDQRRFNRYWNSDQRISDEAAFNKAEDERWLAHEKAESDAYMASVDSFIEKARKPELVTKPQATTPSTPVATPAVKTVGTDWNARAKEYGFDSMDSVKQWQSENGLVADGKFGQNSISKFNELEAQRKAQEEEAARQALLEQEPETLNREGYGTTVPTAPTTSSFESWALANKLDLIHKNGKQYARFDPNGFGDFYVDGSGKIYRAGLMGALGQNVDTIAGGMPEGPERRQYEKLKQMVAGLATHKQGGTMNRIKYFQQGGAAPQQDMQQQVVALVQAAMQGDEKATQTVNQIMEAAKKGDQQAVQIAQMIQQVAKQMQGQAVAAKYGSKLSYLQSLKCGGKAKKAKKASVGVKMGACPECEKNAKLVSKAQNGAVAGASFYRNWSADDIKQLQKFLASGDADLGDAAYKGEIDGKIGSKTIAAVKAYQTKHKLKADGMWGASTNAMQKALGWDTMQKAQYKDNWKGEAGDLRNKSDFTYANVDSLSPKELGKIMDYYAMNPELLFSDDKQHAQYRQMFHNSGSFGEDFLNTMMASLTKEEREKIKSTKTTKKYKDDTMEYNTTKGITEGAKNIFPGIAAITGAGLTVPVFAGAAGLAGFGSLAFGAGGAYAGSKAGAALGKAYGEKHKNDVYDDPVAALYGVPSITIDQNRRINEATNKGRQIGAVAGGVVGNVAGSLTGAAAEGAYYNTLGAGRANLGYKGTPETATPSMGRFGTTTPPKVQGVSRWQMWKAGLRPGEVETGQTRLGGTFGVRFNTNGKSYHAGTFANQPTVNQASLRYNNSNSPLAINFGGKYNTNPGVKIGGAYKVNPYGAGQVAERFMPTTAATSYMATKEEE